MKLTSRSFGTIYGVDFSGAKLAGRNIWIAAARPNQRGRLKLVELSNLERVCGTAEREPALACLVRMILDSRDALWAIDFPFGLPLEVMGVPWAAQIERTLRWRRGAYALGLWCVGRTKKLNGRLHLRRATDIDVKTPFDCYHYRIVYQTFHGMRDVLGALLGTRGTAVAPFQTQRVRGAQRVVVEACPASTLKRLGLPHQNYKQPTGGALSRKRRLTRGRIISGLRRHIDISERDVRRVMRNPGGDALDAVIAAVGAHRAWREADHRAISRHARYPMEGFIYA